MKKMKEENDKLAFSLQKRFQFIEQLENMNTEDDSFTDWSSCLLERLIVDYLLRERLEKSASTFAKALEIEVFYDFFYRFKGHCRP